jgi:hypothetical protein
VLGNVGEGRDFALERDVAGIGPGVSRAERPRLLDRDLGAEAFRGTPDRFGIETIASLRPDDKEPAPPALSDKILRESVREHGPARDRVEEVLAALAPESVVRSAGVEDRQARSFRRIGRLAPEIRVEVRHHETRLRPPHLP